MVTFQYNVSKECRSRRPRSEYKNVPYLTSGLQYFLSQWRSFIYLLLLHHIVKMFPYFD